MEIDIRCLCGNCFVNRNIPDGPCAACGYDPAADKERYPMALHTGSILNGKYIVGRVLGQGGFGITYLAWDYTLKTRVAVKEFFPEGVAIRQAGAAAVSLISQEAREVFLDGVRSFLDEARVLARFQGNLNIVGVREFFEENQTAYFVMDYVEGTSLKSYITEHGGRISWREAARVLVPVMDALEAVHLSGILHRDVTPDNIYLTKNGSVKLLDFGAAWSASRKHGQSVLLKAGYAPIEQYGGGIQGPYTDVYSLAATFYAAVTGFLPPDADERKDRDTLSPPSAQGISVPWELENAILKGLAVQPENRFQSMADFRTAIIRISSSPQEASAGEKSADTPNTKPAGQYAINRENTDPSDPAVPSGIEGPGPNVPSVSRNIRPVIKALIASLASVAVIALAVVALNGSFGKVPSGPPVESTYTNMSAKNGNDAAAPAFHEETAKTQVVYLYTTDPQAGAYALKSLEKLGISGEMVEVPAGDIADVVKAADESPVVVFSAALTASDMETEGMTPFQPKNWNETFYIRGLEQDMLFLRTFEALTADVHVKDEEFWYVHSNELCGTYTGYLVNGDCDGWGVMNYEDGRVYAGYWGGGVWNGRGTVTWPNGDRLECDFVDHVACGSGVCCWADGRRYEGEYANDERNGQGTIYYPDGTSKSGIWKDGQLTG